MPQAATPFIPFHVEHIIARQHLDAAIDDPARLAYACDRCNAFKGPNLTSIDPQSGELVKVYDPRSEVWTDHFALAEGIIVGLTAIGRATVRLLHMNDARRVELRLRWLGEGGRI